MTTPPTPYVPNDGVTTTTTTTTEEPTVSTSESTEGTTESTEGTTEATEGTTEAASVSTTEEGSELPFTGEATGTVLVLAGLVILSGTVVMKRKFSK